MRIIANVGQVVTLPHGVTVSVDAVGKDFVVLGTKAPDVSDMAARLESYRRPTSVTMPRTVWDVLQSRKTPGGCCERFADNMGCNCIEEARRTGGTGCSICNDPKCNDPCGKH